MTSQACLAGVPVGDGLDVRVMGAINVSPDSFYAGSVATGRDALLRAAGAMTAAGAALLDVGAMSTAPGRAPIGEAEEADRLAGAIALLTGKLGAAVSADTSRAGPARAALQAGARAVNDVRGLRGDPALAGVVAAAGAALVLMASDGPGALAPDDPGEGPVETVRKVLEGGLALARRAGIAEDGIVLDPGIGFFRGGPLPWHEWDCRVLAGLGALRRLGRPLCVGVSRKSFIGAITGTPDPAGRLPGSLAAAAAAVLGGAALIRAHDVAETCQAVRVAEAVRRAAGDRA